MIENDKHVDLPKEQIEESTKAAWELLFKMLVANSSSEKATVELCELVEP
jgi:hypothetical protein